MQHCGPPLKVSSAIGIGKVMCISEDFCQCRFTEKHHIVNMYCIEGRYILLWMGNDEYKRVGIVGYRACIVGYSWTQSVYSRVKLVRGCV